MAPRIATVGSLRAALDAYPPDAPVLIAVTPGYPQAVTIGALARTPERPDQETPGSEVRPARSSRADPGRWEGVVWIAEGEPVGYLPAIARDALGEPWTS